MSISSSNREKAKELAYQLDIAFRWKDTKQGHDYWSEVQNNLTQIAEGESSESESESENKEPRITPDTDTADWQCRSDEYELIKIISTDTICGNAGETVVAIVKDSVGSVFLRDLLPNGMYCRTEETPFDLIPREHYEYKAMLSGTNGIFTGDMVFTSCKAAIEWTAKRRNFAGVARRKLPDGKWEIVDPELVATNSTN